MSSVIASAPRALYLPNGTIIDITEGRETVRVSGVGGCYGSADFERRSKHLQGYAKRHYTRDEIETLSGRGSLDILLVHDAPVGVRFERHRHGSGWVSDAAGLDRLVSRVRPSICFFGHHHTRVDGEVAGVRCVGLNKVMRPGNLVAVDFDRRGEWSILREWPKPTEASAAIEGA